MDHCAVNRTQKRRRQHHRKHHAAAADLCCTSSSGGGAAGGLRIPTTPTLVWRRWRRLQLHAIVTCLALTLVMIPLQPQQQHYYGGVVVAAAETSSTSSSSSVPVVDAVNARVGETSPDRPFPAFFIFGDSLVDVGNNNYILSVAKADQLPYGIDFPKGPTGRFSNGKTVLDVVAELINLPFPPAYLDPVAKGKGILQGVNYASGAGGYLRSSGFNFIGRVDFDTQIEWFSNTIQELKEEMGESAAQQLLAKSLFITVFGSNDYVNNYLLSYSPLNKEYNLHDYKNIILQKTARQITEVYKLGARTIVVSGVGPLGCIPSQLVRQRSVNGECSEYVNGIARDFNAGLQAVLHSLSQQLTGSKLVYADSYSATLKIVQNPALYGFKYGAQACCGAGKYKGQLLCLPVMEPCSNRSEHIFWDCFHPSEATNQYLGRDLFASLKAFIYN